MICSHEGCNRTVPEKNKITIDGVKKPIGYCEKHWAELSGNFRFAFSTRPRVTFQLEQRTELQKEMELDLIPKGVVING